MSPLLLLSVHISARLRARAAVSVLLALLLVTLFSAIICFAGAVVRVPSPKNARKEEKTRKEARARSCSPTITMPRFYFFPSAILILLLSSLVYLELYIAFWKAFLLTKKRRPTRVNEKQKSREHPYFTQKRLFPHRESLYPNIFALLGCMIPVSHWYYTRL